MNGVVAFLKPAGMTSSDAVICLKRIYAVKCGHLGTLDPDATGVLPIAVGNATRLFDYAGDGEKEYVAGLRLGIVTTTGDASGQIVSSCEPDVPEEEVRRVIAGFTGKIRQVPSGYSAIKINGVPAYKLARADKEAEIPEREITIYAIECLRRENENTYVLRVECSRGTYIRTLCADIGKKLGCGAYMSFLVRTRACGLTMENSRTMDEIRSDPNGCLMPPDCVLDGMGKMVLALGERDKLFNGVPVGNDAADGTYAVYCENEFFGIGQNADGILKMKVRL